MRGGLTTAVVISWVVAVAAPARADEPAGDAPEQQDPETVDAETPGALTTPLWRQPQRFDLHWTLLAIPETAVEIAASPFALLVGVTEEYRLDRRVADLLELAGGHVKIRPKAKLSFGDGLGLGAEVSLERLFSKQRANMDLSAVYRLDGDYKLDYFYYRSVPRIEGRQISLYAFIESDGNAPYFGINGDSAGGDRRVLGINEWASTLSIDLQRLGDSLLSGIGELGIRHQKLEAGFDGVRIPVGFAGDTVKPPPGFDDSTTYLEAAVVAVRDTRDTRGRPTTGNLTEIRLATAVSLGGEKLSGVKLETQTELYVPVLPLSRVLVLTAGFTTTFAPLGDNEVPLTMLPALGRRRLLRGYERERFRDNHAVWANAEYRFPIYEYLATRVGLDAFLFFDTGTLFGEADLSPSNLRYAYGVGFRGAHDTRLLFGATLGFSPEGYEINFGLGRKL